MHKLLCMDQALSESSQKEELHSGEAGPNVCHEATYSLSLFTSKHKKRIVSFNPLLDKHLLNRQHIQDVYQQLS